MQSSWIATACFRGLRDDQKARILHTRPDGHPSSSGTMQLNLITLGGENLYGDAVGSPLAGAFPGRAQAR